MARIARVVVEGMPHHITQRGNKRQKTFFSDEDYTAYIALMSEWCRKHAVDIWAYCLMPNHIHLIAVPEKKENLRPPSEKPIADIPAISTSGKGGAAICGRNGFLLY